ncbi:MAG: hypothetical protein C4523_08630 [Myxococcales bacterium]|nr:MAG: hypothetical protein C4523_08630 [Myxococcales bacterium]
MDQNLWLIVGGGVAALGALYFFLRTKSEPADLFDDDQAPAGDGSFELGDPHEENAEIFSVGEPEKEKCVKKRKAAQEKTSAADCMHHFEITGIPADRIGTHINLACTHCSKKITVTMEESKVLLRQRDDVREAVSRAKGK